MTQAGAEAMSGSDIEALFKRIETVSPGQAKREIFEALTHVAYHQLEDIWLDRKKIPKTSSAGELVSSLSLLLGIRKKDAVALLGVSESRISRNSNVDMSMLDRAQDVSETFAFVAAALGPEGARAWFKAPNPALLNEPPYRLLGTSYGARRVENLATALLNGAVV